ncbi:MAG: methyltransferase domain-containing protein [Bdellovibrionales bacterium]|nr:methyltransferase domain-containing protein [Bdellovibrionales bacterium]
MKNLVLVSVFASFVLGCSSKPQAPAKVPMKAPASIEEAVASEYRSPEMKLRDQYRHPVETLKFFGVEPSMTVLEISPSAGWYTQILAPYLNTSGQYVAVQVPSSMSDYMKKNNEARDGWLKAHSEITSKAKTVDFNDEIYPENSADMVLTFRNVHNWMSNGGEDKAFKSFYKALKPGGILGVVEHRADPKKKRDKSGKSGYVLEQDVIKMAYKAGFKLVGKSEINANPKDTKNYPEGVWTLPPVLRLKEKDREKYMAIGESDRMTLKFQKVVK